MNRKEHQRAHIVKDPINDLMAGVHGCSDVLKDVWPNTGTPIYTAITC